MFTALVDRPGDRPVVLEPIADTVTYATAAVGGFGDCAFTVPGIRAADLPLLATARLLYDEQIVWEGRIEDRKVTVNGDTIQTAITGFGLQRLLSDNTVRRIWSKRNMRWTEMPGGDGSAWGNAGGLSKDSVSVATAIGTFNPTNLSTIGVEFRGNNGKTLASLAGMGANYQSPTGVTLVNLLGSLEGAGTNVNSGAAFSVLSSSADGTTFVGVAVTPAIPFSQSLTAGAQFLRIGMANVGGAPVAVDSTSRLSWYDMRVLGTSIVEDVAGGFYGDTILKDLLALVPGLTAGIIESGSDYTVQAIERAVRDTALSVVQEIVGYYAREWGVWESGRFDWRTPSLDEAQWVVTVAELSALEIEVSVDTLTKTAYVLYSDAASGIDAESSAAAVSPQNPFVKTGAAKDTLVNPGFPMTGNTSSQFATRVAAETGAYPPVIGRIELRPDQQIVSAVGAQKPAALIRAGDNILIGDLPKDQPLMQGRDGQTLFHIVSTEADMGAQTVTLELEGRGREIDVITARLAASTRVVTG